MPEDPNQYTTDELALALTNVATQLWFRLSEELKAANPEGHRKLLTLVSQGYRPAISYVADVTPGEERGHAVELGLRSDFDEHVRMWVLRHRPGIETKRFSRDGSDSSDG